jgi:hypothetical protein
MAKQGEEKNMTHNVRAKTHPTPTNKPQPQTQPPASKDVAQPDNPKAKPKATDQVVQTGSEGGV